MCVCVCVCGPRNSLEARNLRCERKGVKKSERVGERSEGKGQKVGGGVVQLIDDTFTYKVK